MKGLKIDSPIGIFGVGKIGTGVGKLLLKAGHAVTFGVRDVSKYAELAANLGPNAIFKSLRDTAKSCDVLILAVPYSAVEELTSSLQSLIVGKIVIDATNPLTFSPEGRIVSALDDGLTVGRKMALLAPSSIVVRAFNHIPHELLYNRGANQAHVWAMAIAGDNQDGKDVVSSLVYDAGYNPVDIGSLADSFQLDPGGVLFPHLYTERDLKDLIP